MQVEIHGNCPRCSKAFVARRANAKFCSERCKRRDGDRRRRRPASPPERTCPICAATFWISGSRRYCSTKCSRRAERIAEKIREKAKKRETYAARMEAIQTREPGFCRRCSKELPIPRHKDQAWCGKRCRKRTEDANARNDPRRSHEKRLHNRLQNLLHMRGRSKTNAVYPYLGCSGTELIAHLESQWTEGMHWGNWAALGWNVDHIIPYSLFDLRLEEHRHICLHYLNLRPVWSRVNIEKSDKLDLSLIPEPLLSRARSLGILDQKPYLERTHVGKNASITLPEVKNSVGKKQLELDLVF